MDQEEIMLRKENMLGASVNRYISSILLAVLFVFSDGGYASSSSVGTITLVVDVPGAKVYVDDILLGVVGDDGKTILSLPVGKHRFVVNAELDEWIKLEGARDLEVYSASQSSFDISLNSTPKQKLYSLLESNPQLLSKFIYEYEINYLKMGLLESMSTDYGLISRAFSSKHNKSVSWAFDLLDQIIKDHSEESVTRPLIGLLDNIKYGDIIINELIPYFSYNKFLSKADKANLINLSAIRLAELGNYQDAIEVVFSIYDNNKASDFYVHSAEAITSSLSTIAENMARQGNHAVAARELLFMKVSSEHVSMSDYKGRILRSIALGAAKSEIPLSALPYIQMYLGEYQLDLSSLVDYVTYLEMIALMEKSGGSKLAKKEISKLPVFIKQTGYMYNEEDNYFRHGVALNALRTRLNHAKPCQADQESDAVNKMVSSLHYKIFEDTVSSAYSIYRALSLLMNDQCSSDKSKREVAEIIIKENLKRIKVLSNKKEAVKDVVSTLDSLNVHIENSVFWMKSLYDVGYKERAKDIIYSLRKQLEDENSSDDSVRSDYNLAYGYASISSLLFYINEKEEAKNTILKAISFGSKLPLFINSNNSKPKSRSRALRRLDLGMIVSLGLQNELKEYYLEAVSNIVNIKESHRYLELIRSAKVFYEIGFKDIGMSMFRQALQTDYSKKHPDLILKFASHKTGMWNSLSKNEKYQMTKQWKLTGAISKYDIASSLSYMNKLSINADYVDHHIDHSFDLIRGNPRLHGASIYFMDALGKTGFRKSIVRNIVRDLEHDKVQDLIRNE